MFAERVPVDWDDFVSRAVERRAAGYALAAAGLAVVVLGAPVPATVMEALKLPARARCAWPPPGYP